MNYYNTNPSQRPVITHTPINIISSSNKKKVKKSSGCGCGKKKKIITED